ncbi:MAG: FxLYD domain-containing protein [bacterium]|nr:FxLYD domain-containing protein [bacterium]
MKKAKKIIVIALSAILAVSAISVAMIFVYKSGQNSIDPTEYADTKFISAMSKNLSKREKVDFPDTPSTEDYENVVNAEESIYKFQDATFKDEHLKKLCKDYIDGLNLQKEALTYSTDYTKFTEYWQNGLDARSLVINELYQEYDLKLSDKNKKNFESTAKTVQENIDKEAAIKALFKSIEFIKVKEEYKYTYYEATVENTTEYDFSYMNLKINLIKDDVIQETAYSNIGVWQSGAKVKFEFMTDKVFDKYEVHGDYFID